MAALYVVPAALGCLMAYPHNFEPTDIAPERKRDQGETRQRSVFTWVPQAFTGRWILTQDAFDIFHAWYEDDLKAGAERFDVQVAEQGLHRKQWWTALFTEPYQATHLHAEPRRNSATGEAAVRPGLWQVDVQLMLLDKLGETRFAPSLMAQDAIIFGGTARLDGPPLGAISAIVFDGRLSMTEGVSITAPGMRAEGAIEFGGYVVMPMDSLLLEGGRHLLAEDGSRILLE